jgi:hypothetical protein
MKPEKNGWGSIYTTSHWGGEKKKTATEKLRDLIKIITKKK